MFFLLIFNSQSLSVRLEERDFFLLTANVKRSQIFANKNLTIRREKLCMNVHEQAGSIAVSFWRDSLVFCNDK